MKMRELGFTVSRRNLEKLTAVKKILGK